MNQKNILLFTFLTILSSISTSNLQAKKHRKLWGFIGGGASGAVIGGVAGGAKGAAIGGPVGAAAGLLIGYITDKRKRKKQRSYFY